MSVAGFSEPGVVIALVTVIVLRTVEAGARPVVVPGDSPARGVVSHAGSSDVDDTAVVVAVGVDRTPLVLLLLGVATVVAFAVTSLGGCFEVTRGVVRRLSVVSVCERVVCVVVDLTAVGACVLHADDMRSTSGVDCSSCRPNRRKPAITSSPTGRIWLAGNAKPYMPRSRSSIV